MSKNDIVLSVRDFRAIRKAEIVLDGITVIAGENGSGKSSLSKLFYNAFQSANNFDLLVKKNLSQKLRSIRQTLDMFYRDIYIFNKKLEREGSNQKNKFRELISLSEDGDIHEQETKMLLAVDLLMDIISQNYQDIYKDSRFRERVRRLENILSDVLKESHDNEGKMSLPLLFNALKSEIHRNFDDAYSNLEERPFKIFYDSLREVFPDTKLPKSFEVSEYGTKIISNYLNILGHSYVIQNVAYIDTPMSIGVDSSENQHWDDLNSILKKISKNLEGGRINDLIKSDIINGDILIEQNTLPYGSENFLYKREDGSIFNLLDCATGIKSFAIIQLLLKNGFLNSKTLLIIDEPEAHLHPQWIIEYARLIVLLNKEIGVKFFIASHNPDMVSALKYISEKENIAERVNFYLSVKNVNDYCYSTIPLGNEIEKIFASFNIAIDRINLYGTV
jgi:predicted ATPase